MPKSSLEERVKVLEGEVELLKRNLPEGARPAVPWWEQIAGTFADDPAFDEAMRLGREYRESLRPDGEDVAHADVPVGH